MKKLLLSLLGLVFAMSSPLSGMTKTGSFKNVKMPQTLEEASKILNVSKSAKPDAVKTAYRALIKKYHPDVYKGDNKIATDATQKINAANVIFEKKFEEEKAKKEKEEQQKRAQARARQASQTKAEETRLKADAVRKQIEIDKARAIEKKKAEDEGKKAIAEEAQRRKKYM